MSNSLHFAVFARSAVAISVAREATPVSPVGRGARKTGPSAVSLPLAASRPGATVQGHRSRAGVCNTGLRRVSGLGAEMPEMPSTYHKCPPPPRKRGVQSLPWHEQGASD